MGAPRCGFVSRRCLRKCGLTIRSSRPSPAGRTRPLRAKACYCPYAAGHVLPPGSAQLYVRPRHPIDPCSRTSCLELYRLHVKLGCPAKSSRNCVPRFGRAPIAKVAARSPLRARRMAAFPGSSARSPPGMPNSTLGVCHEAATRVQHMGLFGGLTGWPKTRLRWTIRKDSRGTALGLSRVNLWAPENHECSEA